MPSKKTKSKPEAIRRRLDQLVRCNCAEAGTCDNPDYFADCAGFPSICPHSVPHKPIRGCDDDDAVCPFFAPLAGPCLSPADFAEACRMDALMRDGLPGLKERAYVHRQLVPLAEADLRGDVERGQGLLGFGDCEGLCGV